jgi:hypothetical protein
MVPPESLSQYLSNEYQCSIYGVAIESSNYQFILILVIKVDLTVLKGLNKRMAMKLLSEHKHQ